MNIIITGASRGIGFAIAKRFAQDKHHFFLSSKNEMKLYAAIEELQMQFPQAVFHGKAADLGNREEAIALGNWCLAQATPDILVNNAGFFEPGSISEEDDGVLERQIAVNLYSAYYLTRTLLPSFKKNKRGYIINICSGAGLQAYPNGGSYSISKFAMRGFSENLRHELKQFQIKVITIYPGAVLTDSWSGFDNSDHRIMEAKDIADMLYTSTQLSPAACVENIIIKPTLGDL